MLINSDIEIKEAGAMIDTSSPTGPAFPYTSFVINGLSFKVEKAPRRKVREVLAY